MKRDLKNGTLSRFSVLVILIFVFISSFFTDIIGAHPIFGAFLVGLIVPREHGFVVDLTNKIEDLVHIVLIPIYFALAGFNVNFGELNKGIDWAYIIGIIIIAVVGKVFGGFVSSKLNGLLWRESLTVGVLMSCKGIVEIVVLNVGLNAEIISHKVFSMFVVMTLVSTFLTTPLTLLVYPISYREKVQKYLKGDIDWKGNELEKFKTNNTDITAHDKLSDKHYLLNKLIYNVDSVEGFLPLLNFLELFYGHDTKNRADEHNIPIHAIYLQELTERTTDLIGASTLQDEYGASYNPQLGLLNKIFEFNEIPFISDFKYYVKEDKFETFIESADNVDDLLIYSLRDVDSRFISEFDPVLINSQFGILIKNNDSKIVHIDVVLDSSNQKNDSLLFYLLRTFALNVKSIKVYVKGEASIYESKLQDIKVIQDIEHINGGTPPPQLKGLVITGLSIDTLGSDIETSKEQDYDLLLLREL